jgi:pimeloyl-ACP methyl ester carboxylesterase
MKQRLRAAGIFGIPVIFLGLIGFTKIERALLFFPSHRTAGGDLTPWTMNGTLIGYSRRIDSPKNVWLVLHGNAGQASDRSYAIPHFSAGDSVFILEYPGYGSRAGTPSSDSFNKAAQEAYLLLRATFPKIPVCVFGESIGSGPASILAGLTPKPDKIVLVVPFDRLSSVARDHFPSILVRLILTDDWDNIAALSKYSGPIEIYGAEDDRVIPFKHASALAAALPLSRFVPIPGGHNDWSNQEAVQIRNP